MSASSCWQKRSRFSLLLFLIIPLLSVAISAQTQQPIFPTTEFTAPAGDVTAMATGDFNGDGQPDLAYISVPYYSPTPNSPPTLTVPLNQGANVPPIPVTGDFNHDGVTDIAYVTFPSANPSGLSSLQVLLGSSSGTFTTAINLPLDYTLGGRFGFNECVA